MAGNACNQDMRVLVSCYADGEVTPEEERRARRHLEECVDCRARVEEWDKLGELYQWAYTMDLPEVKTMMYPERTVNAERAPGWTEALRRRMTLPRRRWGMAVAGGFATIAVIAIVAGAVAWWSRPPLLTASLRTSSRMQMVRVASGIQLEVAPNSAVTRMGENWIRLEAGTVRATVRHGARRFRLQSPRLDAYDLGTRFRVGTGRAGDAVTVEEGSVSVRQAAREQAVRAGQSLLILNGRAPVVLTPPAPKGGNSGQPLYDPSARLEPDSLENLDWRDGAVRLSRRFPDLRSASGRSGGSTTTRGLRYGLTLNPSPTLLAGIREHFDGITLGLSGAPVPGNPWEFAIGYVQVTGITAPVPLPADLYLVCLRNEGGRLAWRLTGSRGAEADLPVAVGEEDAPPSQTRSFGESNISSQGGSLRMIQRSIWTQSGFEEKAQVLLVDWPGADKPALRFSVRGATLAEQDPIAARMHENAVNQLGLNRDTASPNVVYLDPARRHRLLTVWDSGAAERMAETLRKGDRSGRAIPVGAIVTDVDWKEPALPAGMYILYWRQPSGGGTPSFEVAAPGESATHALPTATTQGPSRYTGGGHGGYGGSSLALAPSDRNGASDTFHFDSMGPAGDAYRFRVRVTPAGKPDEDASWGQGWISLPRS